MDFVLTSTPHRVSYVNLTPTVEEIQKIHNMAVKMGVLKKKMNMADLIDNTFVPELINDVPIDIKKTAEK